jgi:hypothetical protein
MGIGKIAHYQKCFPCWLKANIVDEKHITTTKNGAKSLESENDILSLPNLY